MGAVGSGGEGESEVDFTLVPGAGAIVDVVWEVDEMAGLTLSVEGEEEEEVSLLLLAWSRTFACFPRFPKK